MSGGLNPAPGEIFHAPPVESIMSNSNFPETNLNRAIREALHRRNIEWSDVPAITSHNELAKRINEVKHSREANATRAEARAAAAAAAAAEAERQAAAIQRYENAANYRSTIAPKYNAAIRNMANFGYELMTNEEKANKLALNAHLKEEQNKLNAQHEANYMAERYAIPEWAPSDPYFLELLESLIDEEPAEVYLEGYRMPPLSHPADIAVHFPFDVAPVEGEDGIFRVTWNEAKVEEGEAKSNVSYAEHNAYDDFALFRALYVLQTQKYKIEPPRAGDGNDVVLYVKAKVAKTRRNKNTHRGKNIRRGNNTRRNAVRRNTPVAPAPAAPAGYERLDDIGAIYPIVWNKLTSSNTTHAYYGVGIHEKKMREYIATHPGTTREQVVAEILEALTQTTWWVVIPGATGSEIARVRTITKQDREQGIPNAAPMPEVVAAAAAPAALPAMPAKVDSVLSRLGLPIVWKQENGVWTVSIHGKKLRESGRSRADVLAALRAALARYSGWTEVPVAGNANAIMSLRVL
jgi:hypothetical protein